MVAALVVMAVTDLMTDLCIKDNNNKSYFGSNETMWTILAYIVFS